MIPPDVANNLRALLPDQQSAALTPKNQPVGAIQRVADALSNLVPGQRILAEVQALLPNGSYRALVAQREVTLALPFSAKVGDSLELEVQESQGKLTLAFVANRGEAAQGRGQPVSVATSLSQAGKLIGDLMQELGGEGKRASPAALNGNQALVSTMPKDAAQLAPVLKQALSQSGIFYEAHQARWVAGKLPTEQLRQEPQGRLPANLQPLTLTSSASGNPASTAANQAQTPATLIYDLTAGRTQPALPGQTAAGAAILSPNTPGAAPPGQTAAGPTAPSTGAPPTPGGTPGNASTAAEAGSGRAALSPAAGSERQVVTLQTGGGIPRDIAPLVQQQLDGLANQNFAWQGQVWPGQKMWWEVGENPDSERKVGEEAGARWRTRLKLDLPVLGGIEARLFLQADNQLSLRILTDTSEAESQLKARLIELETRFQDAGLSLRQIQVEHERRPES